MKEDNSIDNDNSNIVPLSALTSEPSLSIDSEPKKPTATKQNKNSKSKYVAIILVLICIIIGLVGLYIVPNLIDSNNLTTNQAPDGNKLISEEEENIASVAEKVGPSVVSILTTSQNSRRSSNELAAAGTGIIVSSNGYILTNKHVIEGASSVQITLADGTIYENVQILGSDPLNDVAFLKIKDAKDLIAAQIGDSSSVKVGQKVVAIGNALGEYANTVTSGIISGVGRPLYATSSDGYSVESLTDLIQTDAAINPGNSGGPLLNMQGQVIGINTAIDEEAQGIGFSIPINATKGMLKTVLSSGEVKRSYLGVKYIPINPEVAKKYNLPVKNGAYIFNENGTAIVVGSPADKAGIKDGDIITKVGNNEVSTRNGPSSLIAEYAAGDTIELSILRDGQIITKEVTLATYR